MFLTMVTNFRIVAILAAVIATTMPWITHATEFGLEKGAMVHVKPSSGAAWPKGGPYPMRSNKLVEPGSEYYLPPTIQNVDVIIDLGAQRLVQGVATTLWYYSRVKKIEVLLHTDDGKNYPQGPPSKSSWMSLRATASGLGSVNRRVVIPIRGGVRARYVMVRLRGGYFGDNANDKKKKWGLRFIEVAGKPLEGHVKKERIQFGLEKSATVQARPALGATWPQMRIWPKKSNLLVQKDSEYYLPSSVRNVDIILDLGKQHLVQGVATTLWFYSRVQVIEVLLHADDGKKYRQGPPPNGSWMRVEKVASGLGSVNRRVVIPVEKGGVRARYVMVRLRGGYFGDNVKDRKNNWGLRFIEVAGKQSGGGGGGKGLQFGLEKDAMVHVKPAMGAAWPETTVYPMKSNLLIQPDSEYYLPPSVRNIDFILDLGTQYFVHSVATTLWFYSRVQKIEILLHADDGRDTSLAPKSNWIKVEKTASALNSVNPRVVIPVDGGGMPARYVMVRLREGYFFSRNDRKNKWGLRFIEVSGKKVSVKKETKDETKEETKKKEANDDGEDSAPAPTESTTEDASPESAPVQAPSLGGEMGPTTSDN